MKTFKKDGFYYAKISMRLGEDQIAFRIKGHPTLEASIPFWITEIRDIKYRLQHYIKELHECKQS